MTARRLHRSAAVVGAIALLGVLAGCGGGGDSGADEPMPTPAPAEFPATKGRGIAQLWKSAGGSGPVLASAVSELEPGRNRFAFGLFDRASSQIADAPVAMYVAPAGGGPASGPYPARYESLAPRPAFRSRGVEDDPDTRKTLYVADLPMKKPGRYDVLGLVRLDDRFVAAAPAGGAIVVKRDSKVPEVGERAPRTSTPTKADVGGDLSKIDTRQPPTSMHEVDFADVVGRKPALLVFATPALCRSKVCGPVVDLTEQVKAESRGKAEFVHMEIFRDNEIEKGFRPQVLEWNLPTEPWAFAVDRHGRIAARLEGAFSARELAAAVDKAAAK